MPEAETIIKALILVTYLAVAIYTTVWVYGDSQRQGKPGCLVAFLVAMTWPLGLFLWLIVRSDKRDERTGNPNQPVR